MSTSKLALSQIDVPCSLMPARVSGSAGTGKTIVALHRAVFLARAHPDSRVLLTTFSETLANALRQRVESCVALTIPCLELEPRCDGVRRAIEN